jgi:hypothetical protein
MVSTMSFAGKSWRVMRKESFRAFGSYRDRY